MGQVNILTGTTNVISDVWCENSQINVLSFGGFGSADSDPGLKVFEVQNVTIQNNIFEFSKKSPVLQFSE